MMLAQYSTITTVDSNRLWNAITDMANWPEWDHQLEYVRVEGAAHEGLVGVVKPSNGPEAKIVVTKIVSHKILETHTRLPLAQLIFICHFEAFEKSTQVTQSVAVTGPMAWLWALLMRKAIKKALPNVVGNFVRYAAR